MEKESLDKLLGQIKGGKIKTPKKKSLSAAWYNKEGDCIEFQVTDEAVVADRIDEFLTILRSSKSNKPVGFKIKDVQALLRQIGADEMRISAKISNKSLISVAAKLLLSAYRIQSDTINRREGYASAIGTFGESRQSDDCVLV